MQAARIARAALRTGSTSEASFDWLVIVLENARRDKYHAGHHRYGFAIPPHLDRSDGDRPRRRQGRADRGARGNPGSSGAGTPARRSAAAPLALALLSAVPPHI